MSQGLLHPHNGRVRAAKHASRGSCRLLERRHGVAEVVERGGLVRVERLCVHCPYREREVITITEDTTRHGYCFAQ